MARANFNIQAGFTPLNALDSDYVSCTVASAYGTAIYPGDPVIAVSDGTVARTAAGTEGIYGVCVDIIQYKDTAGFVRRNAKYLPASTSWTPQSERSMILVCPAYSHIRYKVVSDEAASTLAVARSMKFNNADHAYGTADTGLGLSAAVLDYSSVATTNTLQWRIEDVLVDDPGNDPTQTRFTVIVYPNILSGISFLGSATGV